MYEAKALTFKISATREDDVIASCSRAGKAASAVVIPHEGVDLTDERTDRSAPETPCVDSVLMQYRIQRWQAIVPTVRS